MYPIELYRSVHEDRGQRLGRLLRRNRRPAATPAATAPLPPAVRVASRDTEVLLSPDGVTRLRRAQRTRI